ARVRDAPGHPEPPDGADLRGDLDPDVAGDGVVRTGVAPGAAPLSLGSERGNEIGNRRIIGSLGSSRRAGRKKGTRQMDRSAKRNIAVTAMLSVVALIGAACSNSTTSSAVQGSNASGSGAPAAATL